MKIFIRSVRPYLFVLALIVLFPRGSEAEPLFKLFISPPKEHLKPGAELELLVTVTNRSDRSITFASSPGELPENSFLYKIDVRDSTGQIAPPSVSISKLDKHLSTFSSVVGRNVQPQQSFVEIVTITRFFNLSKPGNYAISVSRSVPSHQNLGVGQVESNKITVTVDK